MTSHTVFSYRIIIELIVTVIEVIISPEYNECFVDYNNGSHKKQVSEPTTSNMEAQTTSESGMFSGVCADWELTF